MKTVNLSLLCSLNMFLNQSEVIAMQNSNLRFLYYKTCFLKLSLDLTQANIEELLKTIHFNVKKWSPSVQDNIKLWNQNSIFYLHIQSGI